MLPVVLHQFILIFCNVLSCSYAIFFITAVAMMMMKIKFRTMHRDIITERSSISLYLWQKCIFCMRHILMVNEINLLLPQPVRAINLRLFHSSSATASTGMNMNTRRCLYNIIVMFYFLLLCGNYLYSVLSLRSSYSLSLYISLSLSFFAFCKSNNFHANNTKSELYGRFW